MKLSGGCLLVVFLAVFSAFGQDDRTGPIIADFGPYWEIPEATYETDRSQRFHVVFDVMQSPEDKKQVNPWIETAARFLNMHAQDGVAKSQMKVALVVHNQASTDLLDDSHYKARFGIPNPNSKLLRQLMETGVDVVFCGQSSIARKVPIENTVEGIQLSLSAMTALIQFQNQGYRLIKF
ncbi:MAG: DsrE family protein [Robiginitalea sp.]